MISQAAWPTKVALVVFDFDGVMTDNSVAVNSEGVEQVVCNRSDGLGIGLLRAAGFRAMVLSTERNKVVAVRCEKLRIECHHGIDNKGEVLSRYLADQGVDAAHVIYVGNDVNDRDCLRLVGMPVVVADAHPAVRGLAKLVLSNRGGRGAVREMCDLIIERYQPVFPSRDKA